MDRHDLITIRYRTRRWLATFPGIRIVAGAALFAGASAALVSGLMILDSWLISAVDLVLAILFLGVGAVLWGME